MIEEGWWWAKKESAGKIGNAQSDVRAVQSKNERREIKQNSQATRERARVWYGCTNTAAKGEGEAEASQRSKRRERNKQRLEARIDGEKEEGHKYKKERNLI